MYENFEWFVEVLTLVDGQSFGELAIISSKPRAATIRAQTEVQLAIIGKKDYTKTLERFEKRDTEAKIQFFRQIPFLSHWTKVQVERLVLSFNLLQYGRN